MNFSFLSIDSNVLHKGASCDDLQVVQKTLKITLPEAITEFLQFTDGAIIAERAIFFSCRGDEESLVAYNNDETVTTFFRFGRFSSDEFGYKAEDLQQKNPPIYVLDHETNELVLEANNLLQLLEKYNNYAPKKKKWYSFLFS